MHVVLRRFAGPSGPLVSGDVVDASDWKLLRQLLDQRYLRPATPEEIATAGTADTGKKKKAAKTPNKPKRAGRN